MAYIAPLPCLLVMLCFIGFIYLVTKLHFRKITKPIYWLCYLIIPSVVDISPLIFLIIVTLSLGYNAVGLLLLTSHDKLTEVFKYLNGQQLGQDVGQLKRHCNVMD
jgi:hypothetical protein